jgi:hypothetical protein
MGETTIELHRERTVMEIVRAVVWVYARRPWLFFVLAVCVVAPFDLAKLLTTGFGPLAAMKGDPSGEFLFELLDFTLASPLVSALHIYAVAQIAEGERPRFVPVAGRALRVLAVVAAAEIVAGLLIGIGLVLFIVPGVILSLRYVVVAQVAAIDHEGWLPALKRSWKLTRGNYGHILGLLIVVWVPLTLLAIVVRSLYAQAVAPIGHGTSPGWMAVGVVLHTLTALFAALTLAVLYFDLLAREKAVEPHASETVGWGSE